MSGYVLDPTIGASYVCNNGQWSTKPRCLSNSTNNSGNYFAHIYIVLCIFNFVK